MQARCSNNYQLMDMPNQILPFVCPEFSAIIEMSRHFFSWTNGKDFIRDTLKVLEIVRTTFKWKLYFLNDDNLTTALCLVFNYTNQSHLCWLISNLENQIKWPKNEPTMTSCYLSSGTWVRLFAYAIHVGAYGGF